MEKYVILFFFLLLGCHGENNNSQGDVKSELNTPRFILAIYKCLDQNRFFENKSHFLILAGKELWIKDCFFVCKNEKGLFLINHFKFAQIKQGGSRPFLDTCFTDIPPRSLLISYKNVNKINKKSLQIISEKTFKDTVSIKGGFDPNIVSIYKFNRGHLIQRSSCFRGDNSYLDQKYTEFLKTLQIEQSAE